MRSPKGEPNTDAITDIHKGLRDSAGSLAIVAAIRRVSFAQAGNKA
jgi:hypothetical protein